MVQQLVTPTSTNFGFETLDQLCDFCPWLTASQVATKANVISIFFINDGHNM